MTRYMVWVVTKNCEGWGCSLCGWIIATSDLDTTVAALQYNRAAQRAFDAHECEQNGNGAKRPSSSIGIIRPLRANYF
jgi:hypothetical protein